MNEKAGLNKWIRKPSNQIALFAIMISTFGLLFSVYYNRQTLKLAKIHNELSVKPILQINGTVDRVEGSVRFDLENKGLGPAIILQLEYKYDKRFFSNYNDFFAVIKSKANPNLTKLTFNHRQIFKHSTLSANDKIQLVKIFVEPYNSADSIAKIIDKASIIIRCKDIYDNEFEYSVDL